MKYGFLLFLPLLLVGCSKNDESSSGTDGNFDFTAAEVQAKKADAIIKAQNGFGSRLLSQLVAKQSDSQNLLVSPTSVWQALALTASGARGETSKQTNELLGVQKLSSQQVGEANQGFNALLGEQKGATILVANSVWFADSFQSSAAFEEKARTNFGETVGRFSPERPGEAVDQINEWVSSNTKNEIAQIVQSQDLEGQSAALVNAVYFRGAWEPAFDKSQTLPAPFHLESGEKV